MEIGFDNDKYLKLQSQQIRSASTNSAASCTWNSAANCLTTFTLPRVLPGFEPDSRGTCCSSSRNRRKSSSSSTPLILEKNKARGDLGITYDLDVPRPIDPSGKSTCSWAVVLAQYNSQPAAEAFQKLAGIFGHQSIPPPLYHSGLSCKRPLHCQRRGFWQE